MSSAAVKADRNHLSGAAKRTFDLAYPQYAVQVEAPSTCNVDGVLETTTASIDSQQVKLLAWDCLRPIAGTAKDATIGSGATSIVMRASLMSSVGSISVALKVFTSRDSDSGHGHGHGPGESSDNEALKEAAITMGIAGSMINTDGIVKIYGVATGPLPTDWARILNRMSCVAIVMKFEEAGSLGDLLYPKRFIDLKSKLYFLRSLADALRHMHGVGGIHGDLKPQNILLSDRVNPMARLADFGLSDIRPVEHGGNNRTKTKTMSMAGGNPRGTLPYCSPDIIPNPDDPSFKIAKASASSDIYAFGMISWEFFAQLRPYENIQNDVNLCAAVWRGERPSLEPNVVGMNLPQSVTLLIASCWQKEKSLRPDAKHCYEVLSEAYDIVSSKSKDIFFSYCWGNKLVLNYVINILTSRGYYLWFDENNMNQNLDDSMRDGIASSKVFLACISSQYEKSKNCMFELEHVRTSHPDKTVITLVLESFTPFDPTSTAAVSSSSTVSSVPASIWQMGKEMDTYLNPRKFLYCSASNVVKTFPQDTDPSQQNLKDLEEALQPLFKLLDGANCFPSFLTASAASQALLPSMTASSNSPRKQVASPPVPTISVPALASPVQPSFGIIECVNEIKKMLNINPNATIIEAVETANALIGLKSHGALPQQIQKLKVTLGIQTPRAK